MSDIPPKSHDHGFAIIQFQHPLTPPAAVLHIPGLPRYCHPNNTQCIAATILDHLPENPVPPAEDPVQPVGSVLANASDVVVEQATEMIGAGAEQAVDTPETG